MSDDLFMALSEASSALGYCRSLEECSTSSATRLVAMKARILLESCTKRIINTLAPTNQSLPTGFPDRASSSSSEDKNTP